MNNEFSEKLLRSIFNSHSADDLCQHLVHSVLNREGIISAVLCRLDKGGQLEIVGQHGLQLGAQYPTLGLWSSGSLASAIADAEITNVSWEQEPFGSNSEPLEIPKAQYGVVCSPVWIAGLIAGGVQLVFNRYPNQHLISYGSVQLISTAFEPYLSQALNASRKFSDQKPWLLDRLTGDVPTELTPRQLQILQEMASPRTYYQIASRMSVSESLVKQEAGKIFRFVGGRTRTEVVNLAKSLKLIESDSAAEQPSRLL